MIGIVSFFLLSWVLKKLLFKPAEPNTVRYRIKYCIAYFFAKKIKKTWKPIFSFNNKTKDLGQLGVANPPDAWEKDCPRKFTEGKHDADIIEIWGGDKFGNLLLVSLWRRPNRQSEVFLYLKLANGDIYQLPFQPDTIVNYTDGQVFSAAGLRIEIHEPIRRCRVAFNGLLRKGLKNEWTEIGNEETFVDVQFCFTWHPASMYYCYEDFHDVSSITDVLAQSLWTKSTLYNPKFCSFEAFENWGHWYGRVSINGEKEQRLLLRGSRDRRYGVFDWNNLQQSVILKGYTDKGIGVHIEVVNTTETITNVVNGYLSVPGEMKRPLVSRIDWDIDNLTSKTSLPPEFSYNFTANDEHYYIHGKVHNNLGFKLFRGVNWNSESFASPISFSLKNGGEGYGFLIIIRPYVGSCAIVRPPQLPQIHDADLTTTDKIVINFEDKLCTSGLLVGGKGASLAHLTNIKNKIRPQFEIPSGFCVTRLGFETLVKNNKHIESVIKHVEGVAWQKINDSLQDVCQDCVKTVSEAELPLAVKEAIVKQLQQLYGDTYEKKQFAIRSSAIGEDGEELSSAGQNETFLGMSGLKNIFDSIVKCWASQFAFRSVEYRRQNGQLINGGMGVVIQAMVPAESAGVLFSRDPITGSCSKIIISSNFGLGESVVSAASDPDTIIINRGPNDSLFINDKRIGAKNLRIVISAEGGTKEELNLGSDSGQCSISDSSIINLCKVAIELEKFYGNARDLEWAILKNEFFILQSRPVTTGIITTDDEIMHEFDTGLRSDIETATNANIGEVMPGSLTPLMLTADRRVHGVCFGRNPFFNPNNRYDPTFNVTFYFYNHIFFDRVQQLSWSMEEEKSMMAKSLELGFFGRVIDDSSLLEVVKSRYPTPGKFQKIMGMIYPILGMVIGKRFLKKAEERYRNYPVHAAGAINAKDAYEKICEKILDVEEILIGHIQVTFGSNLWNFIILKIIAGDSTDFTLDHYSDFAMLIGSGNGVESGDVPFSLNELANLIGSSENFKNFDTMSLEEALELVSKDSGVVGEKYRLFLNRHGHRGIREFEMRCPSWGMNPKSLMKILQDMVKGSSSSTSARKPVLSIEECIKQIKVPLGYFKRKLLAIALNRCKSGVCYREQAKSMMIKVEDCLRQSFCILADYMVKEGFLPDLDLIYFLTLEEIGLVLKTKSVSLLSRAQKRRRMYPIMDAIHFEEISVGFPKHWDEDDTSTDEGAFDDQIELKAFPVCHGSVKGPARVVTDLKDAHQIQRGDILITHSTDIGWSPYFPLIAGIVTELGGLVSHGAVVAREYGLPCLVAATNATKIFKSGDFVLLDSNNGILRKLS